ncbi:MAG: XdhC/CoxI family protein, partial [Bacillota bacterium]|nr:XdhC/CoxI family protein [Bacillota bacterium]
MKKLFKTMKECFEKQEDMVLVTVIAGHGSTPRGAGARMLLSRGGAFCGTIGGGAVEYRSQQMAVEVLEEKRSFTKGFRLAPNQIADLGMICGGDVVVYFQYIHGKDAAMTALCDKALDCLTHYENAWLITDITDETAWSMGICTEDGVVVGPELKDVKPLLCSKAVQVELEGKRYYSEPFVNAGRVYIFGGGHVAQELVPVLAHVDFRCVVFDELPEFASKELFPQAEATVVGDFNNIFETVSITAEDYIVIVTRGHKYDYQLEAQALRTDAYYIGLIGSRTKTAKHAEMLKAEEGFTDADIARIYTPIGIPIKGETPGEIAISIAGEMIRVRA